MITYLDSRVIKVNQLFVRIVKWKIRIKLGFIAGDITIQSIETMRFQSQFNFSKSAIYGTSSAIMVDLLTSSNQIQMRILYR